MAGTGEDSESSSEEESDSEEETPAQVPGWTQGYSTVCFSPGL